jgi:hypothetical protein
VKRILAVAAGALAAAACSDSTPVGPSSAAQPVAPARQIATGDVIVTSSNDAGAGSFRAAIALANANPSIQTIAFDPSVNTVDLQSTVLYTGSQNLTIHGNKATINGAGAGGTAFRMNTLGADLTLQELTVRDAAGQGVHVEVDPNATGTVAVSLYDVNLIGNKSHGVLVNDQLDPSTQEGVQPDDRGSIASVAVVVVGSSFIANGFSVSDRDGLRVNEGGAGNLSLVLERTNAEGNGADGVEIDERGAGNVTIDVTATDFTRNGVFDPADLDDGFDIDEYNDGDITGTIVNSSANRNYEEGFDINENNNGDLRVDFAKVTANENGEEGIDLEEDDDFGNSGNLVTVMTDIKTFGNGDGADGALKIREKETGNLDVTLTNVISSHNIGSGIFVRESSGGNAVISIENALSTANKAGALDPFSLGHGIELLESGGGDMTASVVGATVSANAGFGVTASASGTATAANVQGGSNALGLIGGIVTVAP